MQNSHGLWIGLFRPPEECRKPSSRLRAPLNAACNILLPLLQNDQKDSLLHPAARGRVQRIRILLELFQNVADTIMVGALSRRELSQGLKPLLDQRSGWQQQEKAFRTPFGMKP